MWVRKYLSKVNHSEFDMPVQLHGDITTELVVLPDAAEKFVSETICISTSEWGAGNGGSVKFSRDFECQGDVPKVVR